MDMMKMCGGFCDLVPPEWHWVMAIVMPLLFIALVGIPVANVLHRAGRSLDNSRAYTVAQSHRLVGVCFHQMATTRQTVNLGCYPKIE